MISEDSLKPFEDFVRSAKANFNEALDFCEKTIETCRANPGQLADLFTAEQIGRLARMEANWKCDPEAVSEVLTLVRRAVPDLMPLQVRDRALADMLVELSQTDF